MSDLFETLPAETIIIMRAQISARIFSKLHSCALAVCIMCAYKMCPATGARFVFYQLFMFHSIVYLLSLTTRVLNPFTSIPLPPSSVSSPVSGLKPFALYWLRISW